MAGSIYGTLFRLTTFGESHGKAIGGVLDGCPSGFPLDLLSIQKELDKRKPGQSSLSTPRQESDEVEFLSGLFEGKTTGTPIAFVIHNKDARSKDYSAIEKVFRPSHADFTYQEKYGIRDHRGGGRASARETAMRVVAGAIAKQFLQDIGVNIHAWVHRISDISCDSSWDVDFELIEKNIVRCPYYNIASLMMERVEEVRDDRNSVGGAIRCKVIGMPVGLGEPVFDKLNAELAKAIFSIPAVKYFELGAGKSGTFLKGSELNDEFVMDGSRVTTQTNNSGGIQGGISNGNDIHFETGFKPVASIGQTQKTLNTSQEEVILRIDGRHDPCVVPRAVPIVEAMTAIVLMDMVLRNKSIKW